MPAVAGMLEDEMMMIRDGAARSYTGFITMCNAIEPPE